MPLDMVDHPIGAGEVAHPRPLGRVVHRVGEVADEDDIAPRLADPPQPERPTENTHVEMDADEHHMPDPPGGEDPGYLRAVVAEKILFGVDWHQRRLHLPGHLRVAPHPLQFRSPGGMLGRLVILATERLIERVFLARFRRDPGAPRSLPGRWRLETGR